MNNPEVLIIGGGISGLSVAWWLSQAGINSQVWEQEPRVGGKIKSESSQGYLTEQGASLVMNFRPEVSQFIQAAGLSDLKTPRSPNAEKHRYLVDGDHLVRLPATLSGMALSPLWSWRGKLRLAGELFVPKGGSEQETVSEFIRRRFGQELLEKAMEPFVGSILASDSDLANAYSVMPRLTALEQRYGRIVLGVLIHKLLRRRTAPIQEVFSFRGGMSRLIETLAQTPGVQVRNNYRVTQLQPRNLQSWNRGWQATADTPEGERRVFAKRVVLCTPAPHAAKLVAPVDAELAQLLNHIQYAPLSLVHLGIDKQGIKHPLDGTGFLVPRTSRLRISGNLWMSRVFPDRAPPGKLLLSSYLGGSRQPQAIEWDDERSTRAVVDDLSRLFGSDICPEMVRIHRHQRALPLYHGDYYNLCRAITARSEQLFGLELEGNYLGGVSVRDRLVHGRATSQKIIRELKAESADTLISCRKLSMESKS
jgi:oxygen-dependent protoporphyrinogen oxidase